MNTNDEKILECLKDLEAARLSRKALWPYLVPIFLIGMFMHAMSRHSDSGFLMAFFGAVCCTIAVMSIDVRAKDRQLDAITSLLTELAKESRMRKLIETYRDSTQPEWGTGESTIPASRPGATRGESDSPDR